MIMIMALYSIFPLRSRFHSRFQVRSDQQILNNLNCSLNITLQNLQSPFPLVSHQVLLLSHQVLRTFHNGIDGRLKARLSSMRCWRFVCSFVVRKLDRSQRRNWGGRDEGNKRDSKKCNPWERSCWKVSSIIVPQILNWAIALRKYSML